MLVTAVEIGIKTSRAVAVQEMGQNQLSQTLASYLKVVENVDPIPTPKIMLIMLAISRSRRK